MFCLFYLDCFFILFDLKEILVCWQWIERISLLISQPQPPKTRSTVVGRNHITAAPRIVHEGHSSVAQRMQTFSNRQALNILSSQVYR